jgi:hypothetical protein
MIASILQMPGVLSRRYSVVLPLDFSLPKPSYVHPSFLPTQLVDGYFQLYLQYNLERAGRALDMEGQPRYAILGSQSQ